MRTAEGEAAMDPGAFPALERLARRSRRVPFVAQLESADCGAACLAMALRYFGSAVQLDEVRARIGSGRDGVDARSILQGAEELGLRGRGLRIEVEDAGHLPAASILHWEFNHFVVLERVTAARRDHRRSRLRPPHRVDGALSQVVHRHRDRARARRGSRCRPGPQPAAPPLHAAHPGAACAAGARPRRFDRAARARARGAGAARPGRRSSGAARRSRSARARRRRPGRDAPGPAPVQPGAIPPAARAARAPGHPHEPRLSRPPGRAAVRVLPAPLRGRPDAAGLRQHSDPRAADHRDALVDPGRRAGRPLPGARLPAGPASGRPGAGARCAPDRDLPGRAPPGARAHVAGSRVAVARPVLPGPDAGRDREPQGRRRRAARGPALVEPVRGRAQRLAGARAAATR